MDEEKRSETEEERSEIEKTCSETDGERSKTEKTRSQTDEPVKNPKKKKHSGLASTLILFALLITGMGILLYPTVSNWWNNMHATRAIASYVEAVEDLSVKERAQMLEAAEAYNARLARNGIEFTMTEVELAEYKSILDITGTGIMGYIQIPCISVNLPIYHTTAESVLQSAVGHLEGTSLPVGGESTHAVLSGHRGLPSARLFTDLDRMREGDIFTITVFDRTVTYMVDQIRIVLPYQVEDLQIEEGADYCTLITCTPYGINTHRMLVRGVRIENLSDEEIKVVAEAHKLPTYYAMFGVGIPLLFILLIILLFCTRKRKPGKSYDEILDDLKKS